MGNPLLSLLGQGGSQMQSFMTFANMMKNGGSPQAIVETIIRQNPEAAQIMEMFRGKSTKDIEKIMRNICAQKGMDFDSTFAQFRQLIGK